MRVVGKNSNDGFVNFINNMNTRSIQLVPHGILPHGKTIAVHAVARGVWHDANNNEYRQLGHGQTVESLVAVNENAFNAIREKHAARRIQAAWKKYRTFTRSVAQNPLVKAALTSSKYMIHLSAHGAIIPGKTFVVPRNMVIVFTTTPGAPAFSTFTETISVNRVRKMILGKNTKYTVAYFEGDTVSEHVFEFGDPLGPRSETHGKFGLFQIIPENTSFVFEYGAGYTEDPNLFEPRSLNIRHNAWQKAARANSQNPHARDLSAIVRYLSRVHALQKPREPLVLVVSTCRFCINNNNKVVREHVARNVAARRRVSGPGYTLPMQMQNVKRIGMTPYLRDMYRDFQNNKFGLGLDYKTAGFVNSLREAGLLHPKFNKATAGRGRR